MKFTITLLTLAITLTACSGGSSTPAAPACTIQSLSVSPNPAQLEKGKTLQLNATPVVGPTGCTGTADTAITWASSDSGKVSVDSSGLLTGTLETGSSPVTVTASAGGKSASSNVSVLAPVPVSTPKTITLNITNPESLLLAAYQDGQGDWKLLEGTGNKRTFEVSSDRYGVLTVCPNGGSPHFIQVSYSTIQSRNWSTYCNINGGTPQTSNIFFQSKNLDLKKAYRLYLGGPGLNYSGASLQNYTVGFTLNRGTTDIFLVQLANPDGSGPIEKILALRDYQVNGDRTDILDFSSAVSVTGSSSVTLEGVANSEVARSEALFYSNRIGEILLESKPTTQLTFQLLPSSVLKTGDSYYVRGYTSNSANKTRRYVTRTLPSNTIQATTLRFAPSFNSPTLETQTLSPYFRPTLNWNPYSGATGYGFSAYRYSSVNKYLSVYLSGAFAQNLSSYTLPDFSNLAGWNNNWAFKAGETMDWAMSASSNPDSNSFANAGKYGDFTP